MAALVRKVLRISPFFSKSFLNSKVYVKNVNNYFHRTAIYFGVKGTEIKMPSLSPTMTEGTIISWLKKEGDTIAPGDVICEVQTDKAVVAFEMEDEGILAKILMPNDSKDVKIGTPIGLMVQEGEDWKNVEIPETISTAVSDTPPTSTSAPFVSDKTHADSGKHSAAMGPVVRTLLEQYGLRWDQVQATGPHGTLLKGDVLNHVASQALKPQHAESLSGQPLSRPVTSATQPAFIDIPLTNMRKVIAKRLTQSKTTIPHAYMTVDCNIGEVSELRNRLKGEKIAVSVNDFIIKAVAAALQRVPEVNVSWQNEAVQWQSTIDISVAVATESGLITPIVKNANHLGIDEISAVVKELAGRAKLGKLQPHEFQGGTFSISNLGMFGITEFSAVINPPQGAILAVGTSRLIPIGKRTYDTKMMSTLSYDARAISEFAAAEFLEMLRLHMENPTTLFAGGSAVLQRQVMGS